ncbi:MAG TPA: FAD-dependent oxidoreductase [Tepidisphaeraceae bacterium]|nr:FAD-dependent oxidoreductase [Tepidisphaeraceae bacterium]
MSKLHVKYLLLGGGLASHAAAKAIRDLDSDGSVLLVGHEINRPYHRPPLSKDYLLGRRPHDDLFAVGGAWYAEHDVQLRTGRRASSINVARTTVALDDGKEVSYDRLLIATGAAPKRMDVPGADLPGLFYLRTLADADRLRTAADKAIKEGRPNTHGTRGKVAVIGGGLLGVELATNLRQLGLAVELATAKGHLWNKFASEATGRLAQRRLERDSVVVRVARPVVRLEGDGRVQRVVVADGGSFDCDFAVAAIGAVATRDLLRNTPIAAENAILVDERCRTSVEGVYAAGDCCAIRDPLFGKHRMVDHLDNAMVTGSIAGTNMAGGDEAYDAVSTFWTEAVGVRVDVWGDPRRVDRRLIRGNTAGDAPCYLEIGVAAEGRVAAVVRVGPAADDEVCRELVRRRVSVNGNEEVLKDPTGDLRGLVGAGA